MLTNKVVEHERRRPELVDLDTEPTLTLKPNPANRCRRSIDQFAQALAAADKI